MFLARVEKKVISSIKHKSFYGKTVFVVQPVFPDGTAKGEEWIAVDYVGASVGDIVVCGGAPGVAKSVFNLDLAPIRTLIMAIVDKIDYQDI
jgi:bacterial microcompartment shell vertex protein